MAVSLLFRTASRSVLFRTSEFSQPSSFDLVKLATKLVAELGEEVQIQPASRVARRPRIFGLQHSQVDLGCAPDGQGFCNFRAV